MIYTVTFNPALDYVVWMDALRPGEINRTQSEAIQYGGKGINVSTVLSALGVENVALGFLAGFTGRALEEGLHNLGIRTDFIWLPEGLTRINVKVKGGAETEINGQGPTVGPVALRALQDKLDRLDAGDILVISGSVPAALSHDVYEQILARLEEDAASGLSLSFQVSAVSSPSMQQITALQEQIGNTDLSGQVDGTTIEYETKLPTFPSPVLQVMLDQPGSAASSANVQSVAGDLATIAYQFHRSQLDGMDLDSVVTYDFPDDVASSAGVWDAGGSRYYANAGTGD